MIDMRERLLAAIDNYQRQTGMSDLYISRRVTPTNHKVVQRIRNGSDPKLSTVTQIMRVIGRERL